MPRIALAKAIGLALTSFAIKILILIFAYLTPLTVMPICMRPGNTIQFGGYIGIPYLVR